MGIRGRLHRCIKCLVGSFLLLSVLAFVPLDVRLSFGYYLLVFKSSSEERFNVKGYFFVTLIGAYGVMHLNNLLFLFRFSIQNTHYR